MKFVVFILLLILCLNSQAESTNPEMSKYFAGQEFDQASLFSHIHQLIAKGSWKDAGEELQRLSSNQFIDQIEVKFLSGLIAQGEEAYIKAANIFESILVGHPELIRVRLELARTYFLMGNDDAAKSNFESALVKDLPEEVFAKVISFLKQIKARKSWYAGFGFALMPDSNINQSTSAQTINIGGLPFTLSNDAKQVAGTGLLLQLYGEKYYALNDRIRLVANGNIVRKDYNVSKYDDMSGYTRLGSRYLSDIGELGIGTSISKRWIGNVAFNHAAGLYVEYSKNFERKWGTVVSSEWQQYQFDISKYQPGPVNTASAKLRYFQDSVSLLEISLDTAVDRTINDGMHRKSVGESLSYHSEIQWGMRYGVNLIRTRAAYDNFDPIFHQPRKDIISLLMFDISDRDWNWEGFTPTLSIVAIDNKSTIELYSYRRYLTQLGANKQF